MADVEPGSAMWDLYGRLGDGDVLSSPGESCGSCLLPQFLLCVQLTTEPSC